MLEKIKVPCPFCDKEIEVLHSPLSFTTRRGNSSLGKKANPVCSQESYDVFEPCPHCGKPANAIKKALVNGVKNEVPKDEMLKRMKEAGIPFRFSSKG